MPIDLDRAVRNATDDLDLPEEWMHAVLSLVAELRVARETVGRLHDAVEMLRHHGSPYRWHEAAWNQGLVLAETTKTTYDQATATGATA
jgi:hypothetical protein